MTTSTRKERGRRTEAVIADRLRPLFPGAYQVGAAASGADIKNTPGLSIEVKARKGLDLLAWMRQSRKNAAPDEIPVVISRLNGQGEQTAGEWPVFMSLDDFIALLERAGYGGNGEVG